MEATIPAVSLAVSVLALSISALTAWLTLLRRGTIRMTRPTTIFFGPDGGPPTKRPRMKVYLRTLLYATSRRGRVIESIYVRLTRGETSQSFSIWVYGDKGDLHRGSGLYVPESGIEANHHFLLPADGTAFQFLPGTYTISVFATVVGVKGPRLLHSDKLELGAAESDALRNTNQGVYFDMGPESGSYHSHIKNEPELDVPDFVRELLG
jgi:hypothetical protein